MSDADETLDQLREKKAKLDEAREKARQDRAVDELRLELRFEEELGARGAFFEIIDSGDLGEGFLVVKLGEEVLWKRFTASKMGPGDVNDLVRPCIVHPSREKYDEITGRRGALASRCANALATLYGVKMEANAGK